LQFCILYPLARFCICDSSCLHASSPPSGNQLFSSSLCPILSLEQTRLKPLAFISPLSSCLYHLPLTQLFRRAPIRPWPAPLLSHRCSVIIRKFHIKFISRSSRPLLSRFIVSLIFLRLFEPVCSRIAFAFYSASLIEPMCSHVVFAFYLASLIEPVCSCIVPIVSIAFRIYYVSLLF
jgi:hypothetical protein